MPSQAEREYLERLKQDESGGLRERLPSGEECRVRILGRGETAFYQRGDRALLFEVLAGRGVIFSKSIRRFDDGKKATDEEREHAIAMMTRLLEQLGSETVEVVRS